MQHLSTLVWLRWRLTRNQWQRQGTASRVIALLVAGLGALLAVAGGVAGVYCGWGLLPECPALVIMLVWDGLAALFLFFWLIGLVSEIQKAEMLDLRHLLHLPISLREAFFNGGFHPAEPVAQSAHASPGREGAIVRGDRPRGGGRP